MEGGEQTPLSPPKDDPPEPALVPASPEASPQRPVGEMELDDMIVSKTSTAVPAPLLVAPAAMVEPAGVALPVGLAAPVAVVSSLEERVRRLEDALAQMQDTQQLESRVAAKVTNQISQELAPAAGTSPAAGLVEIGKRLLAITAPPAPRSVSPRPPGAKPGWLLWELWAEARIIPRMYVDPRYRMTWVGRIVPIVLLLVFFWPITTLKFVPLLCVMVGDKGIIDWLVGTPLQLLIAFVLFKVLSHEVRRYRELSPDLPRSLRP